MAVGNYSSGGDRSEQHHHGGAGRRSGGMAIGFPATPSWEPLQKGLAKGGVKGLKTILSYGQEKIN
jgi:hypothetical protein